MMDDVQPKRRGRPPGENNMVQTAVRLPADLLEFYRSFGNVSDVVRTALEDYRRRYEQT